MLKSSGLFGTLSRTVNTIANSPVGLADQWVFQPAAMLLHKDEESGKLKPKEHMQLRDLPFVGDVAHVLKQGERHVPVLNPLYHKVGKPALGIAAHQYNKLPAGHKAELAKYHKGWRKYWDTVGYAQFITGGAEMLGVGKKKGPKAPRPQAPGQMPSMPHGVPAGGPSIPHMSFVEPLNLTNRKLEYMRAGTSQHQKDSPFFTGGGPSWKRFWHPERYQHEANMLSGMREVSASTDLEMREASSLEIPFIFDICKRHKKEFIMNTGHAEKLAADRLFTQDTYILGDLMDYRGFVNGGFRHIPQVKTASVPYYIRFVHVNPAYGGKGYAQKMVNERLEKSGAAEAWMQVCNDNPVMQKVASKCGFHKLYSFDQNGQVTDVFYRRLK
jgi:ribosomal protein S18 acetylase RimI-like enzyme